MSDEPKFCKDCKHYEPPHALALLNGTASARCTHPEFRSLVTGVASASPDLMRSQRCGWMACLWEEKPAPPPAPETEAFPLRAALIGFHEQQIAEEIRLHPTPAWWEFWK